MTIYSRLAERMSTDARVSWPALQCSDGIEELRGGSGEMIWHAGKILAKASFQQRATAMAELRRGIDVGRHGCLA